MRSSFSYLPIRENERHLWHSGAFSLLSGHKGERNDGVFGGVERNPSDVWSIAQLKPLPLVVQLDFLKSVVFFLFSEWKVDFT